MIHLKDANVLYFATDARIQPPILDLISIGASLEDEPVSIFLNASSPPYSIPQSLSIIVNVFPNTASFDRRYFDGNNWIFSPLDFGVVTLNPPQRYIGSLQLNATAFNGFQATFAYLSIYIEPFPPRPDLAVNSPSCYNRTDQAIYITINASLDSNTSLLFVYLCNVPNTITISNLQRNRNNEYVFNGTHTAFLQLRIVSNFQTVQSINLTISAQAVQLTNGNKAYRNVSLNLITCGKSA